MPRAPMPADPWGTELMVLTSLGHREAAATFLWIGQCGRYADAVTTDAALGPLTSESALELDPRWSVPMALGAAMLHERGDFEGERILLQRGSEAFPDDPWFRR